MHFNFEVAANVFLGVLVLGTLWRLGSFHLVASQNPALSHLGKGMAFQY